MQTNVLDLLLDEVHEDEALRERAEAKRVHALTDVRTTNFCRIGNQIVKQKQRK